MTNSFSILTGPSHINKNKYVLSLCSEYLNSQKWDSFIYVVPSERKADFLYDQLLRRHSNGVIPKLHIYTFSGFYTELYQRMGLNSRPVKPGVLISLLSGILESNKQDLPGFTNNQNRIHSDLPVHIYNTFKLFKQYISNEKISSFLKKSKKVSKGNNLNRIWKILSEQNREKGIIFPEEMPFLILNKLENQGENLLKYFPLTELFIADGFDVFFPVMQELFLNSFKSVKSSFLILDYIKNGGTQFNHLKPVFSYFSKEAENISEFIRPEDEKFKSLLDKKLFTLPAKGKQTIKNPLLSIIRSTDVKAELTFIARKIKIIAEKEKKSNYSDIAVVLPEQEKYLPVLKQIFSDHQISYDISIGVHCSRSSVIAAFNTIIEFVSENCQVKFLLKLLRFPFIKFSRNINNKLTQLNPDILEQISIKFRIIDSQKTWTDVKNQLMVSINNKNSENSPVKESGYNAEKEYIDQISVLEGLFRVLEPLEKNQTFSGFSRIYFRFADTFKVMSSILLNSFGIDDYVIQYDMNGLSCLKTAISELIKHDSELENKIITLKDFYIKLTQIIKNESFHLHPPSRDSVKVLGLLETRGVPFKYVFLCGLTENNFPRQHHESIFYTSQELSKKVIKHSINHLEGEQNIFYQIAVNPENHLFLTFPVTENDEPVLMSSFVNEIQKLSGTGIVDFPDSEDLSIKNIYSRREILGWFGNDIDKSSPSSSGKLSTELCNILSDQDIKGLDFQLILDALNCRKSRTQKYEYTEYEGILSDPSVMYRLKNKFGDSYPFSITSLENYGTCPFKFFCRKVLDLEPVKIFEEEISPMERGSLIHNILAKYYTDRFASDKTADIKPSEESVEWYNLKKIAATEFDKQSFDGILWDYEKERLIGSEFSGHLVKGILKVFLENEISSSSEQCLPAHFELSFGVNHHTDEIRDRNSIKFPIKLRTSKGSFSIVGKIDRIDIDGNGHFIVIDYKTGSSVPGMSDIFWGMSFQLPVYLQIAAALLNRIYKTPYEPVGGCYYQLYDIGKVKKVRYLANRKHKKIYYNAEGDGILPKKKKYEIELKEMLKRSIEIIGQYIDSIRRGIFPVMIHNKTEKCEYCDYKTICRVNHERRSKIINLPDGLLDIHKKPE